MLHISFEGNGTPFTVGCILLTAPRSAALSAHSLKISPQCDQGIRQEVTLVFFISRNRHRHFVLCVCIHYKSHSTAPCPLIKVSPDAWWPVWEERDGYRAATVACLPAATVHTEWTVRNPGRQEESKYLQTLLRCADKPRHLGQYSGTDAPLLTECL